MAQVNDRQAIDLRLSLPRTGAWWCDVLLEGDDALEGAVTLTLQDITLTGTVFRAKPYAGSTRARLVAGNGGWGRSVSPQGYQSASGLQLAPILGDAARVVGERMGTVPSASVGTAYGRTRAAASQVFALLRVLPGYARWWVDDAGVTQVGTRTGGAIQSALQVDSFNAAEGKLVVSADDLTQIRPGRTLSDPVAGEHEVDAVIWIMGRDTLRAEVWAA